MRASPQPKLTTQGGPAGLFKAGIIETSCFVPGAARTAECAIQDE